MYDFHNIFIANILFAAAVLYEALLGKKVWIRNIAYVNILLAFLLWNLFSIAMFANYYKPASRNIIQFLYSFQYIVWVCYGLIDKEKLKKGIFIFSHILAFMVVTYWIRNIRVEEEIGYTLVYNRMWGEGVFPGWPNAIVLPMLFGMYLDFTYKGFPKLFRATGALLECAALFLTTSRAGLLGAMGIFFYFLVLKRAFFGKIALGSAALSGAVVVVDSLLSNNSRLLARLVGMGDRMEIYRSVIEYSAARPFTGYGGNSFDVVYDLFGSTMASINYGHSHSTIFELILRYGYIGLGLYLLYVALVSKQIKSKNDRFMFLLLWGLSLFQIYFRNFVFLILVFLTIPDWNRGKQRKMVRLRIGDRVE